MNTTSTGIEPGPYVVVHHGSSRGLVPGNVIEVLEVTTASVKFQRHDGKKFAVSRAVADVCLKRSGDVDEIDPDPEKPEPFRKGNFSNDLMRKFAKIE